MNDDNQIMDTTDIGAIEARKRLGELLEKTHYQAAQFRIRRKDKPMARLVNERFMEVIDQLMETEPGLADTVALLLNEEWRGAIADSQKEFKAGKVRQLTSEA